MLTYLRYALATFCFAASVGCLGLLWWQKSRIDIYYLTTSGGISLIKRCGMIEFGLLEEDLVDFLGPGYGWHLDVYRIRDSIWYAEEMEQQGCFGYVWGVYYFPLWYPALIFAVAGVASLRLGRRFTIRSAIIATTVVAGLLGIVVAF